MDRILILLMIRYQMMHNARLFKQTVCILFPQGTIKRKKKFRKQQNIVTIKNNAQDNSVRFWTRKFLLWWRAEECKRQYCDEQTSCFAHENTLLTFPPNFMHVWIAMIMPFEEIITKLYRIPIYNLITNVISESLMNDDVVR